MTDMLYAAGLNPVRITITSGCRAVGTRGAYKVPKQDLISSLIVALQTDRLKIASVSKHADELRQELFDQAIRWTAVVRLQRFGLVESLGQPGYRQQLRNTALLADRNFIAVLRAAGPSRSPRPPSTLEARAMRGIRPFIDLTLERNPRYHHEVVRERRVGEWPGE